MTHYRDLSKEQKVSINKNFKNLKHNRISTDTFFKRLARPLGILMKPRTPRSLRGELKPVKVHRYDLVTAKIKYTYHIKLEYHGNKSLGNTDQITETTLTIVSDKQPTDASVRQLVVDHKEDLAKAKHGDNEFLINIPHQVAIIGKVSEENTQEQEGHSFKQVRFGKWL